MISKFLELGNLIQKTNSDHSMINVASINIKYGNSIPKIKRSKGSVKLFSSNGYTDDVNNTNTELYTIIFGCRGTIGYTFFSYNKCFVLNTAMFISTTKDIYANTTFLLEK